MAHDPPGTELTLVGADRVHEVASEILKPGTVRILAQLAMRPMIVQELPEHVPVERCTVSNTPSLLRKFGVVSYVQEDRSHLYHINPRVVSMPEKGLLRIRFRARDGGWVDIATRIHEPARPLQGA
jgi:DNA-binding transcriptional ArsR family regulator